jgi:hypothetical protein
METTTPDVRYIPTDHHAKYGYTGNKPALCVPRENDARCLYLTDEGIVTVDLPLAVVQKSHPVPSTWGATVSYPAERFLKRLLDSGRAMTAEARELIDSLLNPKGKKGKKVVIPEPPPKKKLDTAPAKGPLKTAGAEVIIKLANEWKLPSPKLRRWLRSQGCKAPYVDEASLRKVLKKLKKGGKE